MNNMPPPGFVFIIGALFVPLLKGKLRGAYMVSLPVLCFVILIFTPEGSYWPIELFGFDLVLLSVDELSAAFGYIFIIITFIGVLFALRSQDTLQHSSALLYAGGALGVTFAGDLLSLYIFWELLAVASTFLILARKTVRSQQAAYRYILVHIFGGLCLLGGIVLQIQSAGDTTLELIGLSSTAGYLIFAGVALNAAIPPLHPWLKDAYPEATVTGAVFLCALTTKSAVYVMARTFPGVEQLVWLGAFMTAFPLIYGVLEDDVRRVLAYLLINQVGFMICGIGLGTPLALNGAVAHAFCDILYIGLLFMVAGSVLYMTGKRRFSELGGLYRRMPLTCIFCIVGAASVSGLPLLNDFVSKSIILGAFSHENMPVVWLVLAFSSAGAVLVGGLKVPFYLFFGRDAKLETSDPPAHMLAAMGLAALLCFGIGIFPQILYAILPHSVHFTPYTASHLVHELQLIAAATIVFLGLIRFGWFPLGKGKVYLDVDWFYRVGGAGFYRFMDRGLNALNRFSDEVFARRLPVTLGRWSKMPVRMLLMTWNNLTGRLPSWWKAPTGEADPEATNLIPMGVAVLMSLAILLSLVSVFVLQV